jgi:hypothetical protein
VPEIADKENLEWERDEEFLFRRRMNLAFTRFISHTRDHEESEGAVTPPPYPHGGYSERDTPSPYACEESEKVLDTLYGSPEEPHAMESESATCQNVLDSFLCSDTTTSLLPTKHLPLEAPVVEEVDLLLEELCEGSG